MKFDEDFLREMGLSTMPEEDKEAFLEYIKEELEVRVGERVADGLTEMQLNAFNLLTDQAEIGAWLEKNRPDYREIVQSSIDEMKQAIIENREQLLAGA